MVFNLGTRYHSRGIDSNGNVSNFVETEQLLISADGYTRSYVQIRGSIPLVWKQVIGLKYKPKLIVESKQDSHLLFKQHIKTLIHSYGPLIAINLINTSGYEHPLGIEFQNQVRILNEPLLTYVHFDFHHECKNMKWHRLSILLDQIKVELDIQGFTIVDSTENTIQVQQSVVRTNCIDCLDRTNVLQSILARRSLEFQLVQVGVLLQGEGIQDIPEFYKYFCNLWADHADAISMQYSGTGALKTDFTRTGKRSMLGVLSDFQNSITRYIKNHYMDGLRQDAFDLLLGNYMVSSIKPSPFPPPNTNIRIVFLF